MRQKYEKFLLHDKCGQRNGSCRKLRDKCGQRNGDAETFATCADKEMAVAKSFAAYADKEMAMPKASQHTRAREWQMTKPSQHIFLLNKTLRLIFLPIFAGTISNPTKNENKQIFFQLLCMDTLRLCIRTGILPKRFDFRQRRVYRIYDQRYNCRQ